MEGNYKKWINRINSKQDVLTEDNVGQFMDLELPTKLTPTSGDTVLGRGGNLKWKIHSTASAASADRRFVISALTRLLT